VRERNRGCSGGHGTSLGNKWGRWSLDLQREEHVGVQRTARLLDTDAAVGVGEVLTGGKLASTVVVNLVQRLLLQTRHLGVVLNHVLVHAGVGLGILGGGRHGVRRGLEWKGLTKVSEPKRISQTQKGTLRLPQWN